MILGPHSHGNGLDSGCPFAVVTSSAPQFPLGPHASPSSWALEALDFEILI